MMQSWDENSNLFAMTKVLAALRKENQALTFGSHQQRYLTESVYAYSRKYRDFHAFVVVNQSQATTLKVADTGLPPGCYRCILSGESITVQQGGFAEIVMPAESARVISVLGRRVEGPVVGVFQLNGYETRPGESIALTGDCPELGNWDPKHAYGLEFVNRNTWIGEVPFQASAGGLIHYKFVVRSDGEGEHGQPRHVENILNRRYVLPLEGRVKFDCLWGDD
jgi:cyclomaltodextrin glucanotransferase